MGKSSLRASECHALISEVREKAGLIIFTQQTTVMSCSIFIESARCTGNVFQSLALDQICGIDTA